MKNMRLKLLALAAVVTVGTAAFAGSASADVPGILRGTMRISPVCPVETYPRPAGRNPCDFQSYQSFRLVLKQGEAVVEELHVHRNGKFVGVVQPGIYVIDISPNPWNRPCPIGAPCAKPVGSANVPAKVLITAGRIATFDVEVDTGIR